MESTLKLYNYSQEVKGKSVSGVVICWRYYLLIENCIPENIIRNQSNVNFSYVESQIFHVFRFVQSIQEVYRVHLRKGEQNILWGL